MKHRSFHNRTTYGGVAAAVSFASSFSNNPSERSAHSSHHDIPAEEEDDFEGEDERELNRLDFNDSANFVGREDELKRLSSIYARMCQEQSITSECSNKVARLVLIHGDSGTGKSALVQQFIKPLLAQAPTTSPTTASTKTTTKPCTFCQGKYDQYNTGGTLTAVVDAFSGFLSKLAESQAPHAEAERIVNEIRRKMDAARQKLAGSVIPGLKLLLRKYAAPPDSSSKEVQDDQSLASRNTKEGPSHDAAFEALDVAESRDAVWSQLLYGFKVLIRAIGTKSQPLIIYLDDLQWADQHSLDLITELLLDASVQNMLVIGSYRTNEVHDVPEHRLNQAIPKWQTMNRAVDAIALQPLTQRQVGSFLANTLRLEMRETEPLAAILQQKTKGNILYIIQALEGLRRKKLLVKNINTLKWTWDNQQASKEISLAANVLDLITSKLHSLPKELQQCLMVASFLRSTFNQATLEALVERERRNADQPDNGMLMQPCELDSMLELAIKEGLLERTLKIRTVSKPKSPTGHHGKIDDYNAQGHTKNIAMKKDSGIPSQESKQKTVLRFAHDQIQQAAFSLVQPGDEIEQMRYRMGNHLAEVAKDPVLGQNWMWFVAADQFESISDLSISEQIIPTLELIKLNVRVGEMAIAISAFLPASKYLRRAMDILETKVHNPWDSQNELCLQVHRFLSEVEMYLGNYEVGEKLCKIMLEHIESDSERIAVFSSLGMALNRDGQYVEAIKMVMGALRMLKTFPQRSHVLHLINDAMTVKRYLNKYTDEEILDLPLMVDKKMRYTMHMLRCVVFAAYNAYNRPLLLLAIVRQLRLTFEYGLTGEGAVAFSTYSSVQLNILKQTAVAKRAANLSMKMLELTDSKNVEAHAMMTIGAFVNPWWDPLHKTLALLQRAHQSGMESGELETGYWCWATSLVNAFSAGIPLNQIQKTGKSLVEQTDHYRIAAVCKCYAYIHSIILILFVLWVEELPIEGSILNYHPLRESSQLSNTS